MILTFSWTSAEFWIVSVLLVLNLIRWRPQIYVDTAPLADKLEEVKMKLDDIDDKIPSPPRKGKEYY